MGAIFETIYLAGYTRLLFIKYKKQLLITYIHVFAIIIGAIAATNAGILITNNSEIIPLAYIVTRYIFFTEFIIGFAMVILARTEW